MTLREIVKGVENEKDIKILFIDSNSNGYYFDDTDRVLFNTWNPYKESSKYVSISGFMHNKWYSVSNLKEERFLEFEINEDRGSIKFINANSKYVGIDKTGCLEITNIEDCRLFINGKEYFKIGNIFNKAIEYGKYNMRIEKEGYLDLKKYFEINDDQPDFNIIYEEPERGAVIEIQNIFAQEWILIYKDETGTEYFYPNRTILSLPAGVHEISICSGGYNLVKVFHLEEGEKVIWDYEDDIKSAVE